MPAPVFRAAGGTQSGVNSVNVSWPTHLADDIGLLVIECGGEGTTLTPPAGWASIPGTPVTDVASTAGSKLHVWWKRAASSAEAAVATGDSGDHQVARLFTFRGCATTGDPWDVTTTGVKTTASTTATVPSLTTTVVDTLIVAIVGRPDDSASVTHFGTLVNANLTGIGASGEAGTTSGHGGGFAVERGVKASAGATGTSTLTKAASTTDTYVAIALKQPSLAYTLTADTVAFAQTGQAILVDQTRTAGAGACTLSGSPAGLAKGVQLAAASGGLALSGQAASIKRKVIAESVSLALSAASALIQRRGIAATAGFSASAQATGLNRGYRLSATSGSIATAGGAANFRRSYVAVAGSAAFALAGGVATLRKGKGLLGAESASFTVAGRIWDSGLWDDLTWGDVGNNANLYRYAPILAASGAVALSGSAATLSKATSAYALTAGAAALSQSGQSAALKLGYRLTAASAGVALTGQPAALRRTWAMPAASGGVQLNGQSVSLNRGRILTAAGGVITLSGPSALIQLRRAAQTTAFNIAGATAALKRSLKLTASGGSVALTGGAATLPRALRLVAATATCTSTGQAAALLDNRRLNAAGIAFALAGGDTLPKRGFRLLAGSGGTSLGGGTAAFTSGRGLLGETAPFAVGGSSAGLRAGRTLNAQSQAFSQAGGGASFSGTKRLTADAAGVTASGSAAGMRRGRILLAAAAGVIAAPMAAALRRNAILGAGAVTYTLSGNAASLARAFTLLANTAAFAISRKPLELRYLRTRGRLLDCLANGPDPTFTDRYGGSDNTEPAFQRPYYVQYNAVGKSRDLGSTEILEANLNGSIGTQRGTNTLYFKVTLVRDLELRVERNSTGAPTDRYVSVGVLDANRAPVQIGVDGYCYLNDVHNTSDDESLARMPAGTYYITVSSNQWQSIPYDITITVGRYAILEGPAIGLMAATGRLPLVKPLGSALAAAPLEGTILRPGLIKKLASVAALGTAAPSLSLAILRGVALGEMLPAGRLKMTWKLSGSSGGSDASTATLTSQNDGGYGYGY